MARIETASQLRAFVSGYFRVRDDSRRTLDVTTGKDEADRDWQSFTIESECIPAGRSTPITALLLSLLQASTCIGGRHAIGDWIISHAAMTEFPRDDGTPVRARVILKFTRMPGIRR
jgi:hypothetical protein